MEVITRASDVMTLMRFMLRELKLPANCTHPRFVEGFAALQKEAKQYEEELRHMYEEGIKQGRVLSNGEAKDEAVL